MIDFKIEEGFVDISEVAKLVRVVLKESFPGEKFSVRVERYAGGSHVNVGWTDGPNETQVETVCAMFQTKHWDGMTDSYTYTHRIWQGEKISFAGTGVSLHRKLNKPLSTPARKSFCETHPSKFLAMWELCQPEAVTNAPPP